MTYQNLLDLARLGNVQAIDILLNRVFRPSGITAKTAIKDNCLHLLLEGSEIPNQQTLVPAIRGAIVNLGIDNINTMMIYGRQVGTQTPAWSQTVLLEPYTVTTQEPPRSEAPLEAEVTEPLDENPWPEPNPSQSGTRELELPTFPTVGPVGTEQNHFNKNGNNGAVHPRTFSSAPAAIDEFPSETPLNPVSTTANLENYLSDNLDPVLTPIEPASEEEESNPAAHSTTEGSKDVRRFSLGKSAVLVGLAALSLGIMTWHSLVVSKQNRILDQAKALTATAATADNAKSIAALQDSERQLQEAVTYLRSTPSSGVASRQIEQELMTVEAQLQAVKQRLVVEQAAVKQFTTARKLANEAVNTAQAEQRSLKNLQTSQQKLQQAIALLSDIPTQTFLASDIDQKLPVYRANLAALNRLIKAEQERQQRVQSPPPPRVRKRR